MRHSKTIPGPLRPLALAAWLFLSACGTGILVPATLGQQEDDGSTGLPSHEPITILSDDEFTPARGVRSGSGSASDPYVISDWEIRLPPGGAPFTAPDRPPDSAYQGFNETSERIHGLHLQYTQAHVLIRNVHVFGSGPGRHGIFIERASNATVESAAVTNTDYGIYLIGARDVRLEGNRAWGNVCDMELRVSENVTMRQNEMSTTQYGFGVRGNAIRHYVHDIDESNTIGGLPILYRVGGSSQSFDGSHWSFVGLVDSHDVSLSDISLSRNVQGAIVAFSDSVRFSNVSMHSMHGSGIDIIGSHDVTISRARVEEAEEFGIYVSNSTHVSISESTLRSNGNGIFVEKSDWVRLEENELDLNHAPGIHRHEPKGLGVELLSTRNATIVGNKISDQEWGVSVHGSGGPNTIRDNGLRGGGITSFSTTGLRIEENRLSNLTSPAFKFRAVEDVVLANNRVRNASSGLELESWDGFQVSGNSFEAVPRSLRLVLRPVWDLDQSGNQFDATNTADGKSWSVHENERDLRIAGGEVALVALFGCANATIEDVDIEDEWQGVLLVHSRDVRIRNATIGQGDVGVVVSDSQNIGLTNVRAWDNRLGVSVTDSSRNVTVSRGASWGNTLGIHIESSTADVRFEGNILLDSVPVDDRSTTTDWTTADGRRGNLWLARLGAPDTGPYRVPGTPAGLDASPLVLPSLLGVTVRTDPPDPASGSSVVASLSSATPLAWSGWQAQDAASRGPKLRLENLTVGGHDLVVLGETASGQRFAQTHRFEVHDEGSQKGVPAGSSALVLIAVLAGFEVLHRREKP